MNQAAKGKLYLVPSPLDFGCEEQTAIADVLPTGTLQTAANIRHWICENAKSTRATLKRIAEHHPLVCALQEMTITELPRDAHKKGDHSPLHNDASAKVMLTQALQGFDIGLMSEAGMPAIADPGSSIVRAAHSLGIEVVALTGPVSLMLALASSGHNGQNFAFNGYLPQETTARRARIHVLEKLALSSGQTQMFIETPYRNIALFSDLLATLQATSRLSISVGLTLSNSQTISLLVKDWRTQKERSEALFASKLPAIFCFGL